MHCSEYCSEKSILISCCPVWTKYDSIRPIEVKAQHAPHPPWSFMLVMMLEARQSSETGVPSFGDYSLEEVLRLDDKVVRPFFPTWINIYLKTIIKSNQYIS